MTPEPLEGYLSIPRSGDFSRGEKILESGTGPEPYIIEYTLEDDD
jgi:hypothetical protein